MKKVILRIFSALLFLTELLFFTSCIDFPSPYQSKNVKVTEEDVISAAKKNLKACYGGSYSRTSGKKAGDNSYIEIFSTSLKDAEGNATINTVTAKIDYSIYSNNTVDYTVSADYLVKKFEAEEIALYEPLIQKYFNNCKVILHNSENRYCPASPVYAVENGKDVPVIADDFDSYKRSMYCEPSIISTPLNQNKVDVYFIATTETEYNKERIQALFYEMMKNGYWINGKFLVANATFTDFSAITEETLTDEYISANFDKVYTFDCQEYFNCDWEEE